MKSNNTVENLVELYTSDLLKLLEKGFTSKQRTYGFEYEFISDKPLTKESMSRVYEVLEDYGFKYDDSAYASETGMYITIEPGGQIEYCSPPIFKEDGETFQQLMGLIKKTNKAIKDILGIDYIGKGYIPNRADAPMILDAKRYHHLHDRMLISGTRGREMMKGTASIHLHSRILDMHDVVPLFNKFLELSKSHEFAMSSDRRDIWDHTDPVRSGQLVKDLHRIKTPEDLIHEIVRFTMNADDIGKNIPFLETNDTSFEAFLYHLTTIFTDIRLNLKGPSWELRTLDSQPVEIFEQKWKRFINSIEEMNEGS
jgi:glutamate--cysteine ligase